MTCILGTPARRHLIWLLGCALVVLFTASCDDPEGERPVSQPPPDMPATTCPIPAIPVVSGPEVVVGDGTAASCSAATLQEALDAAGPVRFECGPDPVTITIETALVARDNTHVIGGGLVTLDGANRSAILRTDNHATVVVEGLTLTRGNAQAGQGESNGAGGAIFRGWQSNLTVIDCVFTDNKADAADGFGGGAIGTASSGWTTIIRSAFVGNQAPYAGAVYSMLSDLTVIDSHFEANEATSSDGGAIFTDGGYTPPDTEHGTYGGKVEICGSRFVANRAPKSAAAGFFFTYGIDQLIINQTEFRGNQVTTADPGLGGAIRIDAEAFVSNSLFVDNTNAGQGGALWMGRGPAVFENVTFFRNHAELWGGAISYGEKAVVLNSCTLAYNTAGEGADTLFGKDGALEAHNTLFAHNGLMPSRRQHCNAVVDGDHNLAFPVEDGDLCGSEFLNADPLIGPELGDHGGATPTLAIEEGSAASGAGTACPSTDQRGEPRQPDVCDIGAFEL